MKFYHKGSEITETEFDRLAALPHHHTLYSPSAHAHIDTSYRQVWFKKPRG